MPEILIKMPLLYKFQQDLLQAKERHRLAIISRRAGKTEVAAQAAVEEMLAGRRVLWLAPTLDQVEEAYFKILDYTEPLISGNPKLKRFIKLRTKGSITFRSTERHQTMRGKGYHLVIYDEYAGGLRLEDTWAALRPLLSQTRGRFLGIGTPNGHNYVYSQFMEMKDNPNWLCTQLDWRCSPNLTEEEMREVEKEMEVTPGRFRQEHLAEFIAPQGALFDPDWLREDTIYVDKMPNSPQRNVIAVDMSRGGLRSDYQAIVNVQAHDGIFYCDAWLGRQDVHRTNRKALRKWEECKAEYIAYEINGFQGEFGDDLLKQFAEAGYQTAPVCLFETPPNQTKEQRVGRLAQYLARGQLKILRNGLGGQLLYNQLSDFPMHRNDDGCDAVDMAIWSIVAPAQFRAQQRKR